jgi:predicted DNA-binding transcriptional regulator AlpA
MRVITMDHRRMQFGLTVPDEIDLDLVRFDHGCLMLGISLRTAYSRLNDENSDMPRPFSISGGRQRFFRRSDLVAYVARKAEEAQRPRPRWDAA